MFDLEKAIRDWKKGLAASPGIEDGFAEELESHLRDKIPGLVRKGMSEADAFRKAADSIGGPDHLGSESFKVRTTRRSGRPPWHAPRFVPVLFWNAVKLTMRRIRRQKGYSFITIAGLALSLACGFLILFHVKDELSYESCFPKVDRIDRVRIDSIYGPNTRRWARSAPALGPMLEAAFPDIEAAVRLTELDSEILSYRPIQGPPRRFKEDGGFLADPSVFSVFDLEFIRGDSKEALDGPGKTVLAASVAERYFGGEDPVGKVLVNESRDGYPLQVSGVIRDLPRATHLKIDYLVSMPTLVTYAGFPEIMNHRTWKAMLTYVLFRPGRDRREFEAKAPAFMKSFLAQRPGVVEELRLQPIRSIHLHSRLEGEIGGNSDIAYVYIFSAAAVLLLLVAGINFVNLATAQSIKRTREIGIRKAIGARRGQLVKQTLAESLLMTALSAGISLGLLALALPFYNRLAAKSVQLRNLASLENAILLAGIVLLLGLLAGIYPALFSSGFRPAQAVKSLKVPRSAAARLRKGLVFLQFAISIVLVFSTLTLSRQLAYFHHRDLGFDKDRLVALELEGDLRQKALRNADAIKAEILRHPEVTGCALVSQLPGRPFSNERLTPVQVTDKNALPMLRFLRADEGFIRAAGLTIVRGRDFDPGSDRAGAYIVGESTAAALGLDDPLGVRCRSDIHGGDAPIVGVIKDFHFASLHGPIEPLVLEYPPSGQEQPFSIFNYLLVKTSGTRFADVLDFLKRTSDEIAPGNFFQYRFVGEVFDGNYRMEDRALELFKVFSLIALAVACLGLFGLAAFAVETRVKEIGVRKVLGASTRRLAFLLSREFLALVLAANILAWPAAYLLLNRWLQNFAFRVRIDVWSFLASAGLALVLAAGTVGSQAYRSARTPPVKSLRYE